MPITLNREDLAWAAGFFDGEGHVGHNNRNGIRIQVDQCKSPELLIRMQEATGVGTVTGPYGPYSRNPQHSPFWTWRVHGFEKCQHVMAVLWPWLGEVKREQFRVRLKDAR